MQLDEVEVLILCGGKGTRLRSVVSDVPKPMAPVANRPFLEYLLVFLAEQGLRHFCFLSGYKGEVVEQHFAEISKFLKLNFRFSQEKEPLGTGGAIRQAVAGSSQSQFLVLNGDTFFALNIAKFTSRARQLLKSKSDIAVALRRVEGADRYGTVLLDEKSAQISDFSSDKKENEALINAGSYYFHKEAVAAISSQGFVSIENDVFPALAKQGQLYGVECGGFFIDIGVPEDYARANEIFKGDEWKRF